MKWKSLSNERETLISELNNAINAEEITLDKAKSVLAEFDSKEDPEGMWSRVKDKHRNFLAKRKEALFLARQVLQSRDWLDPLMKNGYSDDDKIGCIEWYLNGIKFFIDKNSQDLKDLNKRLKKLEGEDDDE